MLTDHIEDQTTAGKHGPALVAVLVHGTWAPEAAWTRDGSPFRSQLEKHLGVPVQFRRLCWSGINSHRHRLEAAAALRELLRQSLSDNPTMSHFIIAHSHGGNATCYAMQDDALREAVRGVICLATPFLHVQRNPLPRSLLAVVLPTLAILALFGAAYLFRAPEDPATKYFVVGAMALAAPFVGLSGWALLRKRRSRLRWRDLLRAYRRPTDLARELALPILGVERLLAVRISGDEASGGLAASQFFVWLFRRTWSRLAPIWQRLERLRRALSPSVGFILAGFLVAGWLVVISQSVVAAVSGIAVAFLALFGVVAVIVGLIGYVILAIMLLMHVPVGLDAMFGSLSLQTTAEPTPPGEATVFHIAPSDDDAGARGGLRHSAVYEDPEAIRFVASWMRARLNTRSSKSRDLAV